MDDRDLIKSKVDLVALVGEVVELKKAGANWKGRCPFHGEKTPSFMVNPEMGIFKCFGCGEGGDCFSWLMKTEGMSFGESLKYLAEKVGVTLKGFQYDKNDVEKQDVLACIAKASSFYKYLLLKNKVGVQALEYLHNRGITNEAIEVFGLGYAPEEWDVLLKTLKKSGFSEKVIEQTGLSAGEGERRYDRFRGRVIFELRNQRGQVVGLAGRLIVKNDQSPKYINSPETVVYHKGQMVFGLDVAKNYIREKKQVIVVEGELDMISSWQVGVGEVVALKGTAFTEDQVKLISRYAEKVILALDMDFAGDKAARKSIKLLHQAGLDVRMAMLPSGKDPDDVAREDAELWKQIVNEAVEVYKFMLDSAVARYDLNTAIGKQRMVDELIPIWKEIPNDILRSHWIGELARVVGVSESLLVGKINFNNEIYKFEESQFKKDEQSRELELEELLVGWMALKKNELDKWDKQGIENPWVRKALDVDRKSLFEWKSNMPAEIAENLSVNIMKLEDLIKEDEAKIDLWIKELGEIKLRRSLKFKKDLLKQKEGEGSENEISVLTLEIMDLTKQLSRLKSG